MSSQYKVLGFIPCHYGREYMDACVRSLAPFVDKIVIIYSDQGTQGTTVQVPCPESENELRIIAEAASDKVVWVKGYYGRETDHRSAILQFASGYDLILSLDTDEVLEPADVPGALEYAMQSSARYINIKGFINFWRSFNHVCLDGFLPYRIMNLHNQGGMDTAECRIYHFGCAQDIEIVRYKWLVSGHRNEVKKGWIEDIYLAWTPENQIADLHCVSYNLWNAVPFPKEALPDVLKDHPNFNKEVI